MQRRRVLVIIASLIIICFSLYFILYHTNSTKQLNVETEIMNEAIDSAAENIDEVITEKESDSLDKEVNKEEQAVDVSINIVDEELPAAEEVASNEKNTLTEGINEKVKQVVEGVFKLFKKDLKVVAIGDSLTQGVGDETENGGYVGILNHTFENNNINVSIENYGKKGNRSDELLKRLEKKKIKASIQQADIVFVTIGANDIMTIVKNNITNLHIELFNEEREEYIKRLEAIIKRITEINPNTKIYIVGFYNPFDRYFPEVQELQMIINDWNEASKTVTEEFDHVRYIPILDLFSNSDIELLSKDHFHPNTNGYKLMAKRILENMEEISVEQKGSKQEKE
ncbi:SGNH/GDSL hydrolase family protein [Metabacillus litoralis]|uniref:SGNH/GDSL hydrolase family protein n=1 Tax=Metabacillus litoralis TaxID=152268 RepID=UPI001CFD7920|nr:SGNH/GDSL hydrolase family protein [Metabacillus litoralis]